MEQCSPASSRANGYAFYADGELMGLVRTVMELKGWGLVLGVDLVIALPYALLTVTTGSIGSLLYLLRKPTAK